MIGSGTLVNFAAVIVGGGLGSFVIPRVADHVRTSTIHALGLTTILIGLQMAWKTQEILLLVVSLAVGTIIGELLRLEDRIYQWAGKLERLPMVQGDGFGKAFVQASLLYCTGAMAITGALKDGLSGDASVLYAKSILDGISAVMFGSALGPGVMLSAVPILLYQGVITLGASGINSLLTEAMVREISAIGGLMVAGIGLNLVGATQLRVASWLPALVVITVLVGLGL
ncbi:MAG TPA: DUF554 domain-containing protein [Symbiobacteriaceae bacterium]|nr:DUF554 domain-containing protein [Symbiobacteriaceae bacterium]